MSDPYDAVSLTVKQVAEALSQENLYFTSQKLGRQPTSREALVHFIDTVVRPPQTVRQFIASQASLFEEYPLVCPECGQKGDCVHCH